jgi:hypothetical protein
VAVIRSLVIINNNIRKYDYKYLFLKYVKKHEGVVKTKRDAMSQRLLDLLGVYVQPVCLNRHSVEVPPAPSRWSIVYDSLQSVTHLRHLTFRLF